MSALSTLMKKAVVGVLLLSGPAAWAGDTPPQVTQSSQVTQSEMDAAVARQRDQRTADSERVKTLLRRDDVRAVAKEHGLDLVRAERAVDTLDSSELRALASQSAMVESGLAGGDQTVSISLTVLLLILIIVILLVR